MERAKIKIYLYIYHYSSIIKIIVNLLVHLHYLIFYNVSIATMLVCIQQSINGLLRTSIVHYILLYPSEFEKLQLLFIICSNANS